jgi:ABC-2 type transport system permease protein
MSALSNVAIVARREYLVRARTRSFIFGTALLVAAVVAVALLPIIVSYFDRTGTQTIGVWVAEGDVTSDPVTTLERLLNAPTTGQPTDPEATPDFTVTRETDLDTARQAVIEGDLDAVLGIERAPDGELQFTLYTEDTSARSTGRFVGQQATTALAIADRLDRLGVDPTAQAGLFAPSRFALRWPDPTRTDPAPDSTEAGASYLLGFGLTILVFMLIVLYGNWIAMSVVEEKSSRVMEVILNAATPLQLLSGKVLGVGAVALTQYAAILLAGAAAVLAQGELARMVLGESSNGVGLPAGLTIGMLLLLGVFGVLGFLLYGVLYAAAGSLVSRQEDVQAAVMPLALVSTAGYLVAVYASMGLIDIDRGWLALLALVPFVSPFLMLSLVTAGEVSAPEIVLAVVLLVAAIGAAMWIAARIYAAGVLLYGQRPGLRSIWRMARAGM